MCRASVGSDFGANSAVALSGEWWVVSGNLRKD